MLALKEVEKYSERRTIIWCVRLFGMNFFEEFSDFSTLDYDIPNLCKKSVKSIALVAILYKPQKI